MRKRIYRSIDVKQVDAGKVAEIVRGKRVVVGVDVAKEVQVAALMNEKREVMLTMKWRHPKESVQVVDFLARLPSASLEVAMEPSGSYGDSIVSLFARRDLKVYRVSAKRSHDLAEAYDGVPSLHDAKSAAVIAKLHWDGASRPWEEKSEEVRSLSAMIGTMTMYDEQYHRNLNRLEAQLARYWPEATEVLGLESATLLNLISTFGTPQAIAMEADRARKLMRVAGGPLLGEEKREQVIEAARLSVGVIAVEGEREALMELGREALRNRGAASAARRRVEDFSEQDELAKRLSPVVGKASAAVLLVAVGDPREFACARGYLKGYGLNLKERSSGKHKGQLKISKRGPGAARSYLYFATLRWIQKDDVLACWYKRKVERDGGKAKMKAVVAVMRKLAAALWHVARGEAFDSTRLCDVKRLNMKAV